jgi:hypothetical protein
LRGGSLIRTAGISDTIEGIEGIAAAGADTDVGAGVGADATVAGAPQAANAANERNTNGDDNDLMDVP